MNIALLGNGKTGSRVRHLAIKAGFHSTILNSTSRISSHELTGHDVVISFVPGDAFVKWIPTLLQSGLPVVSGSTGFNWPEGRDSIKESILQTKSIWVHSGNFSLGSDMVLLMLKALRAHPGIHDYRKYLTESHHKHKIDAPSGTALLWEKTLGSKFHIRSVREGDIMGIHELELNNNFESITIRHEVTNRDVFAGGALKTARFIHENKSSIEPGLYDLLELMTQYNHLYR